MPVRGEQNLINYDMTFVILTKMSTFYKTFKLENSEQQNNDLLLFIDNVMIIKLL